MNFTVETEGGWDEVKRGIVNGGNLCDLLIHIGTKKNKTDRRRFYILNTPVLENRKSKDYKSMKLTMKGV